MARRYRLRTGRGGGFNPNFRFRSDLRYASVRDEDVDVPEPTPAVEPTPGPPLLITASGSFVWPGLLLSGQANTTPPPPPITASGSLALSGLLLSGQAHATPPGTFMASSTLQLPGLTLVGAGGIVGPPAYLGEPIAYVLFGGNGNFPETGYQGIAHYDEWAAMAGPIFQRHGITRVYMQNPAGVYPEFPDTDMRIDQWLIAEQRGFSFANRAELRTAFEILASYGIVNVLAYIGSPYQLADPVVELPLCVEPFVDAADGVLDLTMGFDAMFYDILLPPGVTDFYPENWQPNSPRTLAIQALPCDVYAEARLEADMLAAGVDAYVQGTIALNRYDETHAVDYEAQPGETVRITETRTLWDDWPEVADWPEGVVPAYQSVHNWGPTAP